jgi:bacterioferritin-associated ferredoxin
MKYVCKCEKLTEEDIEKAINKGASNYKEIKKATGIHKDCCKKKVKEILEKHK